MQQSQISIRDLVTERDYEQDRVAELTKQLATATQEHKLREIAEVAYASEARSFAEPSDLSREQKALSVAIAVLERHQPVTIKTEQELEDWLSLLEQKKHVIGVLSAQYGYGDPIPNDGPPQSREIKQFNSFSARHNEALNKIDYYLEFLHNSLEQAAQRATTE